MDKKSLFSLIFLVLGLVFLLQVGRAFFGTLTKPDRLGELTAEVASLQKEKEELEEEKVRRQTAEFVEREARDKLNMTKPGEHVVVLPDEKTNTDANEPGGRGKTQAKPNWEKWVDYWFR